MLRWAGDGILERVILVVFLLTASVAFRSAILLVVEFVARTLLRRCRKAIRRRIWHHFGSILTTTLLISRMVKRSKSRMFSWIAE